MAKISWRWSQGCKEADENSSSYNHKNAAPEVSSKTFDSGDPDPSENEVQTQDLIEAGKAKPEPDENSNPETTEQKLELELSASNHWRMAAIVGIVAVAFAILAAFLNCEQILKFFE